MTNNRCFRGDLGAAAGVALLVLWLGACGGSRRDAPPAESMGSTPANSSAQAANFKNRVGLAVSTASRTCMAVQNSELTAGTAVTLVSAGNPEANYQATVAGTAEGACPITKEVDTTVSNYDIKVNGASIPKLVPLVAIVGVTPMSAAPDGRMQTDLEQNGRPESFRACGTQDGIHLTMWQGAPLSGALVWHGFYYDPSNAVSYPACTAKETVGF